MKTTNQSKSKRVTNGSVRASNEWPLVLEQLKELLAESPSTVILLVVDQSITTISQHCTTGVNAAHAKDLTTNIGDGRLKRSKTYIKQTGSRNNNTVSIKSEISNQGPSR